LSEAEKRGRKTEKPGAEQEWNEKGKQAENAGRQMKKAGLFAPPFCNLSAAASTAVVSEQSVSAASAAAEKQKDDPAAVAAAVVVQTDAVISVAQCKQNNQPAQGDPVVVFTTAASTVCSS
jgi:hypothetical protein